MMDANTIIMNEVEKDEQVKERAETLSNMPFIA